MKFLKSAQTYLLLVLIGTILLNGCKKENLVSVETNTEISSFLDNEESMYQVVQGSSLKLSEEPSSIGYSMYNVIDRLFNIDSDFLNYYSHVYQSSELSEDYRYYAFIFNNSNQVRNITLTEIINGSNRVTNYILQPYQTLDYAIYHYSFYYNGIGTNYQIKVQSPGEGTLSIRLFAEPSGNFLTGDSGDSYLICKSNTYFEDNFNEAQSLFSVYSWTNVGELGSKLAEYNGTFNITVPFNLGKFAVVHSQIESCDQVIAYYSDRTKVGSEHVTCPTTLATVQTYGPIASFRSVYLGGNVTNDGGSLVTEHGVCWSTSPNPSTSNSKVSGGSVLGEFSYKVSLSYETRYYIKSYAINGEGTSYGNELSFVIHRTGIEMY